MKIAIGLKTKIDLILLGSLVALACLGSIAFETLQNSITNSEIKKDIAKAKTIVKRLVSRRVEDLTSHARLVADLPTLKSSLATLHPDPITVHQRFLDYSEELHANGFVITDDLGRLITNEGSLWNPKDPPKSLEGVQSALAGKSWSGVLVSNGQLTFEVSAPVVIGGYVKGTVSLFNRIDAALARELAADLGTNVAFFQNNELLSSSIRIDRYDEVSSGGIAANSHGEQLIGSRSSFPGTTASQHIDLVSFRNFDELAAPFRETQKNMMYILMALMGVLMLISRTITGNVISQIRLVTRSANSLQEGEWPEPIRISGSDEIGLLQASFNKMSQSLQEGHRLLVKKTEDLNAALIQAKAASRAKAEFLSKVSHELRTPLNGIYGMTELLGETELDDQQSDCVTTISASNQRLLTLINDVLSYSELQAGRGAAELQEFDMGALIQQIALDYAGEAKQKQLKIDVSVSEECRGVFRSDAGLIRKLVSNLVSNAIKFTDTGSVTITAKRQDDHVLLAVKDTGCGISRDRQEEMFLPFQQADNSSVRKHGGTGLGLSICRQIAEVLGGELSLTSSVGAGSTFVFTFAPEFVRKVQVQPKSSPLEGMSILVVDDNAVNLKVAAKVLANAGANVECADSGIAALGVDSGPFDLILMDCHMPEMDGFECTSILRQREHGCPHRTPIFALTASNLEEDRKRSELVGMDGFLVKPLQRSVLEREFVSLGLKMAA